MRPPTSESRAEPADGIDRELSLTTGGKLGVLCEIGLVITNIGTAVVLYPIGRRYSETLSLSWVASRIRRPGGPGDHLGGRARLLPG